MTAAIPLILGSGSPRRKKILQELGCAFRAVAAEAAEIHDATDPVRTVAENALAKYRACRRRHAAAALITADTLVWFEGRLIGKPVDLEEAAGFLRSFSGRVQTVFTGLALGMPGTEPEIRVEASSVLFKTLSEAAISEYLERTRPLDRAGAYDIDENGELLIAGYSGSYTNIMGLPQETVRDWLARNGL
ncbi:MAG: Maf family protein [Kiritimatiellae bacterium]|nr:Maf family protein [Kiritimatiellia bacterium]